MRRLAKEVDVKDMGFGNIGGHVWQELKTTPGVTPKWSIVKNAKLWDDAARFGSTVWPWLTGKGDDILSAEASPVMTQQGEVLDIEVVLGERKDRLLCGQLGPILNSRSQVNLMYVEVTVGQQLQGDVLGAIQVGLKQKSGVGIIYWGTDEAIDEQLAGPLGRLLQEGQALGGYKTRMVKVFLQSDDPLGDKDLHCQNVDRVALLISPKPFKSTFTYVVSQLSWTPTILTHLIRCMDMIRPCYLYMESF